MKPVSVRFKCFGPYMDEQFIDFEELEKNGLFLICGETGAGKTTILDAICYALYCESSGGLRGDIENMRCKLAEKTDETLVEFIFDSHGKRYKFARAMKYKTKNLHKYHNCYIWNGTEWEVLDTGLSQVTARAERLVGLTCGQFRQVIILPQGKFEEFLVSDSKKKEEILVTLFNVQQWSRICEEITRRVNQRAAVLEREKTAIAEGLRRYGCANLEALGEKRVQMETELEALIPQAAAAETAEAKARETLQIQLQVAKDHQELARRQKNLDALKAQEPSIQSLEASLVLADRAEQVREVYEQFHGARRELNRAAAAVQDCARREQDAMQALAEADARLEGHQTFVPAMEEKKGLLLRLENARPVYENLQNLRQCYSQAHIRLQSCGRALEEKQQILNIRDGELAAAFAEQEQARTAYDRAQIQYRLGIGGILAATLEMGKPCPVCGSREHPAPARNEANHVSESQLDKLAKAMSRADKAVTAAISARTQAEQARNEAQSAFGGAREQLAAAQADCENAEKQKIAGIEDTNSLLRVIGRERRELESWETAGKKLLAAKTEAQGSCLAAKLAMEKAVREQEQAEREFARQNEIWEDRRGEAGFASEQDFLTACLDPREKQRRRERTAAFRSDWKVAESALKDQQLAVEGKPLQDIQALQQALNQAEQTRKALVQHQILLDSGLNTLRADEKSLALRIERNRDALIALEADQVFARRLSGVHGVSLQRYVLGVMMNSITAQANRLLQNVYGGRYKLYRTDETTGRTLKGGLELEVFDSQNSQRRSVRTLSGGEKFLVALSLAIGLSAVVQAQGEGIRLEAMFIDEGFGSLDREAIQDALEILQGIRRTAGVVGIISHVEALAETIPARIEITKGKRGSSAKILGI